MERNAVILYDAVTLNSCFAPHHLLKKKNETSTFENFPVMAAAQSLVTIQKFGGTSSESWTDFESLFRSLVEVANIDAAQRVGYLKLQLKDSALQFFHTLDNATRGDLELTLTALKNHFCNPNLKEIHL